MLFFIPDEFICETLQTRTRPLDRFEQHFDPLMIIDANDTLQGYFHSMYAYFAETKDPDASLLELKFKELVLNIADNPANLHLLSYFSSLMHEPHAIQLQRVMEDNFCFNLKLEAYAELSNRSLSAFKRDFEKLYRNTPGKWLLEKRLHHALHLISNREKSIGQAAFESGFESPSHFSRAFKARFGKAPTEMKDQATRRSQRLTGSS